MNDFLPYITNDNSVGLYDKDVDDIYHSASGALSEAFEKFILPIDFNDLKRNKNINVLDICYGIGYNTKAFLSNFVFNNRVPLLRKLSKISYLYIYSSLETTTKEGLLT